MDFLNSFGAHNFLIRDALVLLLLGLSVYVVLNAGMFAMPQIGFMAIGAYVAAVLNTRYGMPLIVTLGCAALSGAAVGLVLGAMLRRLDGIYLAIATIGFSEIVRLLARNLGVTGGASGLLGVDRSLNDVELVAIVVIAFIVLERTARTRFGDSVTAIRQDPLMAAHQGIDVGRYRMALFAASGLLAGAAGGMYVHITGYAHPSDFTFGKLIAVVAAVVLGGATAVAGSVMGVAVTVGLPEFLGSLEQHRNLFNGALAIVIIALAPTGLVPLVASRLRRAVSSIRRTGSSRPAGGAALVEAVDHPQPETNDVATGARPSARVPVDESDVVLDLRDVVKSFGGVTALKRLSLEVRQGEVLGVIGPNGSGKTTFLNVLSGVYIPDAGHITIDGVAVGRRAGRPEQLARLGIARTFQTIRIISDMTVFENVALGYYLSQNTSLPVALVGAGVARRERAHVRDAVHTALDLVGMDDAAEWQAGMLPYGMQRRVEIARAIVRQPHVLLLDEPTAGMTPAERTEVFEVIDGLRSAGIAVVVVEHDVESIRSVSDRVAVLNFGELIAVGSPDETLEKPEVIHAYIGHASRD